MKIKDFKKLIDTIDPEREVIMSKDGEGNGFSPFYEMCFCYYVPDSTYSGELFDEEDELIREKPENAEKAVVLWPVN